MTTIRSARLRAGKLPATADYGLRISAHLEKRMRRCRAPVRAAIQKQLAEIAASAGSSKQRGKAVSQKEPPLRFYVYEGYRVAYHLDADTRRVVMLDLQLLPVD